MPGVRRRGSEADVFAGDSVQRVGLVRHRLRAQGQGYGGLDRGEARQPAGAQQEQSRLGKQHVFIIRSGGDAGPLIVGLLIHS